MNGATHLRDARVWRQNSPFTAGTPFMLGSNNFRQAPTIQTAGVYLVETQSRARHQETRRADLARAIFFLGGMYSHTSQEEVRARLLKINGVIEVLATNYVETPYGIVQVFYDSRQVSRDEVLARIGPPYYTILIEDKDPYREQVLLRYTEVYVC